MIVGIENVLPRGVERLRTETQLPSRILGSHDIDARSWLSNSEPFYPRLQLACFRCERTHLKIMNRGDLVSHVVVDTGTRMGFGVGILGRFWCCREIGDPERRGQPHA